MARKRRDFTNRVCNLVPSSRTEKDWEFEDAVASGAIAAGRGGSIAAVPSKVDLRASWWTVGDQGLTGSCVGWAVADLMRWHLVKAGRLKTTELLSSRFIWMASKETDDLTVRPQTFIEEAGTSLKAAADIVRKYGVVPESTLPFRVPMLMYPDGEKVFYALASTRRALAYFNLGKNTSQWRTWIATQGPILAALSVDDSWYNASTTAGRLDVAQAKSYGGHAVCVVGYTSDRFIIRNSWGPFWGDKGFGYASESYIYGAFFAESYGVTV